MAKKKSTSQEEYQLLRWKPGEPVALILYRDNVEYKVSGYEVFNPEKTHSITHKKNGGKVPIKAKAEIKYGFLLVIRQGQEGKPILYHDSNVMKILDVPKSERKSFDEAFGMGTVSHAANLAGISLKSEIDDLTLGLSQPIEIEDEE